MPRKGALVSLRYIGLAICVSCSIRSNQLAERRWVHARRRRCEAIMYLCAARTFGMRNRVQKSVRVDSLNSHRRWCSLLPSEPDSVYEELVARVRKLKRQPPRARCWGKIPSPCEMFRACSPWNRGAVGPFEKGLAPCQTGFPALRSRLLWRGSPAGDRGGVHRGRNCSETRQGADP